jgi:hypothetical protein
MAQKTTSEIAASCAVRNGAFVTGTREKAGTTPCV